MKLRYIAICMLLVFCLSGCASQDDKPQVIECEYFTAQAVVRDAAFDNKWTVTVECNFEQSSFPLRKTFNDEEVPQWKLSGLNTGNSVFVQVMRSTYDTGLIVTQITDILT